MHAIYKRRWEKKSFPFHIIFRSLFPSRHAQAIFSSSSSSFYHIDFSQKLEDIATTHRAAQKPKSGCNASGRLANAKGGRKRAQV